MGDAEKPVLYFESIRIGDTDIPLESNSVIAFIGPNNVGKTTAIMELQALIRDGKLAHNNHLERVVKTATIRTADLEDISKWLMHFEDETLPEPIHVPERRSYRNWGSRVDYIPQDLASYIKQTQSGFSTVTNLLLTGGGQVQFEGATPNFYQLGANSNNKQFEQLYMDKAAMASIAELSREAFATPVSLSRRGSHAVLHFGDIPPLPEFPTSADQAILKTVPTVGQQGEGVRALMQLGISMRLGYEPLVFLDEPEAHLHPPQERLAGKYIASRTQRSQIFLTTHSVELLLGLLDAPEAHVVIVRLNRSGNEDTQASVLGKQALQRAWKDPLVRYSRALSGLMHKGVVICEADGDCLYYEATLEYERIKAKKSNHDLLFIHTGGKTGAKKVVPALKSLAVPLCVIVDFDMLRSWKELSELFGAMGGDPATIRTDWQEVNKYLTSKQDKRTEQDIKNLIDDLFKESNLSSKYGSNLATEIKRVIKVDNGWEGAKDFGLAIIRGVARTKAERLLAALTAHGLIVCPFGQLESFHPEVPTKAHGPQWIAYVMDKNLYTLLPPDKKQFIEDIPTYCH